MPLGLKSQKQPVKIESNKSVITVYIPSSQQFSIHDFFCIPLTIYGTTPNYPHSLSTGIPVLFFSILFFNHWKNILPPVRTDKLLFIVMHKNALLHIINVNSLNMAYTVCSVTKGKYLLVHQLINWAKNVNSFITLH